MSTLGTLIRIRTVSLAAIGTLIVGCATPSATDESLYGKQVGPYKQCSWDLVNGLEPFKNSARTPGFEASFNPFITVSKRGLTVRVVGVLSDATLARYDGSLERVVAAYPYLIPVRFTARHVVQDENLEKSARWRDANPRGEITSTEVIELPPNSVMLIYPVSIAAQGFNTASGNWVMESKDRARPNDDKGPFGGFPFLKYTWQGHALHGPITGDRNENVWGLRRGKVSHGCNRMEGEHVVELAVLLGCPVNGNTRSCGFANESVTVMEEFDYIPDPVIADVRTGVVSDYAEIYEGWVSPDVAGFARDPSYPLPDDLRLGKTSVVLDRTLNKAWSRPVPGVTESLSNRPGDGVVPQRAFRTWDNRDHADAAGRPYVKATDCRG